MKFKDIFPIAIEEGDLDEMQDMIRINYENINSSAECVYLKNNSVELCHSFNTCGGISNALKNHFLQQNRKKEKNSSITFLSPATFE